MALCTALTSYTGAFMPAVNTVNYMGITSRKYPHNLVS